MVTNHARNRNTTSMLIHKLQDKFMYKYIKERELQLSMQGVTSTPNSNILKAFIYIAWMHFHTPFVTPRQCINHLLIDHGRLCFFDWLTWYFIHISFIKLNVWQYKLFKIVFNSIKSIFRVYVNIRFYNNVEFLWTALEFTIKHDYSNHPSEKGNKKNNCTQTFKNILKFSIDVFVLI